MKNKELTQYKNQVNSIPMRKWTAEEMNFFFAVLTKMRDEGTREIHMNKYELAELARYTITHNKRYHDTMKSLGKKLQSLTYFESTTNSFEMMPFFTKFKARWKNDLSDMVLDLKVNEEFEYILNKWNEGNWTKFMLDEFISIDSTYSKTLFRLLKQWRTKGKRVFSFEEFKRLMDIPDSYNVGRINSRIINNGIKDLEPYFDNLKVKIVKANTRGNPVTGYIFTWKPEKTEKWENNKHWKKKKRQESVPDWFNDSSNQKGNYDASAQKRMQEIIDSFAEKEKIENYDSEDTTVSTEERKRFEESKKVLEKMGYTIIDPDEHIIG